MALDTAIPISELTKLIMVQVDDQKQLESVEDFVWDNLHDYTRFEFKCILDMIEVKKKLMLP